jgi:transcriptional regulator with XRE-family HTH domain
MRVGVATFQGKRLKEGRLARGLFKNALGDMIGVTGTAITRYEEGLDNPQHDKLSVLADKLNFPYNFFLKPAWPEDDQLVFWRSRAT